METLDGVVDPEDGGIPEEETGAICTLDNGTGGTKAREEIISLICSLL